MMHAYLREIEAELKKHFLPDEVSRILAYYQKEFEKKIEAKEDLMTFYRSLNLEKIKETWLPKTLKLRKYTTLKVLLKSVFQILRYMFGVPALLPYGMILSLFLTLYTTGIISLSFVVYQALSLVYTYFIDIFYVDFGRAEYFLTIGIGITFISLCVLITIGLFRFLIYLIKVTFLMNVELVQVKEVRP